MNELSILAKFIQSTLISDTYWMSNFPDSRFFEEVIAEGIDTTTPNAMFVSLNPNDEKGAFGYRLYFDDVYEIKAVVAGYDYSLIEDMANQIDRLFDWQNQIDIAAGRPKSQEVFTDPDDNTKSIMVMGMMRNRAIKYTTFDSGTNYCHLGGEYYIQAYAL